MTWEDRFWSKVDKNGPIPDPSIYGDIGPCWTWTGATKETGHAVLYQVPPPFGHGRRLRCAAYRLSFYLHHGRLPDGHALHNCDNPRCVNPHHIREGTQRENVADRHTRGRSRGPRGEDHGRSTLTADDVRLIRARKANGESLRELAVAFNTVPSNIAHVVHRRSWAHVE